MERNKDNMANYMTAYFGGTLLIFVTTFYAAINIVPSDYPAHALWASKLSIRHLLHFMQNYTAYPLWHIITKTFYKVFNFELLQAAAATTAIFNCFVYLCVNWVWDFFSVQPLSPYVKSFWTCCLLFAGPLYAPWFSEHYYLGQGSGNTWHNPTNISVKGFAILCFFLIVQLLESSKSIKEESPKYILLGILIFFSALAKPSFLQGIIPGLGVYFIISLIITKGSKDNFIKYCAIAGTFIPAAVLLIFQFFFSFLADTSIHNGGNIGIEFGRVLGHWSPNLLISFLLAFAFPLFIFILDFKNSIRKISIQVALCYEFCAWGESALLYESGSRELHGNWLWGSYLSMFIVWMLFLFQFFNIISDDKCNRIKRNICLYGGSILFFSHLVCGIFYWYNLTSA